MAGNGPMPKEHRQRERDERRRNAEFTTVTNDGILRGPDFPYDVIPNPHPATVEWWETWRRAPQASLFLDTDWQTLKRAAKLQDDVYTLPRASAAAVSELRLIEERLGGTYVDRQKARIRVDRGEPSDATVTPLHLVGKTDAMARLKGDK